MSHVEEGLMACSLDGFPPLHLPLLAHLTPHAHAHLSSYASVSCEREREREGEGEREKAKERLLYIITLYTIPPHSVPHPSGMRIKGAVMYRWVRKKYRHTLQTHDDNI
jgi:hypothetical protein